jgi:hypothetical protein
MLVASAAVQAQEKDTFKPSGHIVGKLVGDYYYKFSGAGNNFSDVPYAQKTKNFNAFDFRKVELGGVYRFRSNISAKLEIESKDTFLYDGKRPPYLKIAQLKISEIIPNGSLLVGQTETPTFATTSEDIWGYRSLAKTLPDMRGFGDSEDFGVALDGYFRRDSTFAYTVMIGNGTGSRIENNKYKKVYLDLRAYPGNRLRFELYSDYEGNSTNEMNTGRMTFKGFAGYQLSTFTVGLSGSMQFRRNAVQNHSVNSTPSGLSIFAHGALIKDKLNGVIRYDFYNPDRASRYDEHFMLVSLDYIAAHHVHFMPNLWINAYAAKDEASTLPASVLARMTFYYNFP